MQKEVNPHRAVHTKTFDKLTVSVSQECVTIEDADLGYKYGIPVYEDPKRVARMLRRAADFLENVPEER